MKSETQTGKQRKINRGDVYWIHPEESGESELGFYPHPYVIVQDDLFNHSRVHTVIVCALTSNLKQAKAPGNILLEENEANLPKQSVVEVSKVSSIAKSQLGEYIGTLSDQRVEQILTGMRFLHLTYFNR